MDLELREDNETCITVIKAGRSNKLRHIHRVHGVSISFLHDQWEKKAYELVYEETGYMCADILTKAFPEGPKWAHAVGLLAVGPVGAFPRPSGRLPPPPPRPVNKKALDNVDAATPAIRLLRLRPRVAPLRLSVQPTRTHGGSKGVGSQQ